MSRNQPEQPREEKKTPGSSAKSRSLGAGSTRDMGSIAVGPSRRGPGARGSGAGAVRDALRAEGNVETTSFSFGGGETFCFLTG